MGRIVLCAAFSFLHCSSNQHLECECMLCRDGGGGMSGCRKIHASKEAASTSNVHCGMLRKSLLTSAHSN